MLSVEAAQFVIPRAQKVDSYRLGHEETEVKKTNSGMEVITQIQRQSKLSNYEWPSSG